MREVIFYLGGFFVVVGMIGLGVQTFLTCVHYFRYSRDLDQNATEDVIDAHSKNSGVMANREIRWLIVACFGVVLMILGTKL